MKGRLQDYLLLHFIVFIWGFTAILGKLIEIGALELVLYRTLFAFIILGVFMTVKKRDFVIGKKEIYKILGTGVIIGLHWIFFFASTKVATVSVCLAGMATATLWTSILEPLIGRRRVRLFEVLLGLIIILGLYIIFKFEFNHLLGLIFAVFSAFLAALFLVINSRFAVKHDHYTITFYEMVGAFLGTAVFLPAYAFWGPDDYTINLVGSNMDYLYLLILASICTVYPFSISVELMKRLTVFSINLTINLEPVYGIILAVIIFKDKERMSEGFYLGTLIILLAVITHPFIQRYRSQRRLKPPA
ncbi:DMT family transporter [Fulvivirgaceae bacterium BMA12]|uniref:DMT family transporter n=1 Tax=Agaribacillus aureus TaxID=3051825 RepID=A0ABT8L7D3_9BACT|nr:DMT family transporter [Fulvivirgaceae bacterium BMA12]